MTGILILIQLPPTYSQASPSVRV